MRRPEHNDTLHFKKINMSNPRVNKVEKLQLPSDFRSTLAANLCEESHHSKLGPEVCADDDTYGTLSFHRRIEGFTFTNVKKELRMLLSQRSARLIRTPLTQTYGFF